MNPRKFALTLLKKAKDLKKFNPDLREGQAIIIQLCRMNQKYFLDLPIEKSEDQEILFLYDSDVRYKVITEEA